MATAVAVSRTNNPEIDGLLGGTRWSGTITYSFPDSPSDYSASYQGDGEPTTAGFSAAPVAVQQAITYAFALLTSYTNASVQFAGTNGADIAIAQSPAANPTAYAYYPYNVPAGGDIWFGNAYNYSQAALGNYYFATAVHELGHALGLKHSQETGGVANVAVPAAHDNLQYSVMSYRSYPGGPLTGYTNEAYGYPQTYMANDILALQTLYGANFTTHSENTVYSWSSTTGQQFINGVAQLAPGNGAGGSANRIFETVWDGNGIDTYDLSNYTTAVTINLNPGASSVTSAVQLAYLGNGHYASGNIYNAYLYNNDARSYIDNALGGSNNDTLVGNAIANYLNGGGGNDTLNGGGGNDTIVGGGGTDVAVFSSTRANYLITYNSTTLTYTVADLRSGTPDGTDTITGVENFQFSDGTIPAAPPQPDLRANFDNVSSTTIAAGGSTSIELYTFNAGSVSATASTTGLYLSTDATITTSDNLLMTVAASALTAYHTTGYYDHQTISLTLPGNLTPGTYYIGGIADYTNVIAESNETNNTYNVTQITVSGPAPAPLPDLRANFDNVSSTTIAAGGSTSIELYTFNAGSGSATAPSTTGLYLSTDATITTGDSLLMTVAASALTAYHTTGYYDHQTVSLTLPGNLTPGTYYIGGIADYTNVIAESNETNNTYNVTQITVSGPAPAPLPDLRANFDNVSSTTIAAGGSTSIELYTFNAGSGSATASTTGLYLSTDATITTGDSLLMTVAASALTAYRTTGYYDHQTVSLTLPGNLAPGTYYIGGIADYTNVIAESNETNNTYNVTQITVSGSAPAPLPDLRANFDNVSNTTIAAGGSTSIELYTFNAGSGSATASTTGLYLSTDATITTSDNLLMTVAASALTAYHTTGYYDHQTVSLTLPGNLTPGTYYIGGIADYTNVIAESNETNNTYNVTQITVSGPAPAPLPDLRANFDNVSSTTIAAGGSTSIELYTFNAGSVSATAPSTTGLYLSTDATITTSDNLLMTVSSTALTAYHTTGYYDHQTVSLTLPGNLAPGTYYIGGIADYTNVIAESNETNNNYNVVKITVGPAAFGPAAGADTAVNEQFAGSASNDIFMFNADLGKETAGGSPSDLKHLQFDYASAGLTRADTADIHHLVPDMATLDQLHHLYDFLIV